MSERDSRPDRDVRDEFVVGMRQFLAATKRTGETWEQGTAAIVEVAKQTRALSRRVAVLASLAAMGFVSTAVGGIALGYRLEAFSEAIRGAGDQAAGARDQAAEGVRKIEAISSAVASPSLEVRPGVSGEPVLIVHPASASSVEIPIGGPGARPKRTR